MDFGTNIRLLETLRVGAIGIVGEGIGSRIQGINFTDAAFTIVPGSNTVRLSPVLTYGGIAWLEYKITSTIALLGMGGFAGQEADNEIAGPTRAASEAGLAGLAEYAWFAAGMLLGARYTW